MKQIITAIIVLSSLTSSCNSPKPEAEITPNDGGSRNADFDAGNFSPDAGSPPEDADAGIVALRKNASEDVPDGSPLCAREPSLFLQFELELTCGMDSGRIDNLCPPLKPTLGAACPNEKEIYCSYCSSDEFKYWACQKSEGWQIAEIAYCAIHETTHQ